MKKFKLLSLLTAAAISASCFAGMAISASAESYQYNAEAGVITAGTTVNTGVEGIALTYGFSGGNDFTAPKNNTMGSFTAFTEGNKENGTETSGTNYIFDVSKSGTLVVGIVLNADKNFFVTENGSEIDNKISKYAEGEFTAVTGTPHKDGGVRLSEKIYGITEFDVKAGKQYKVYCTGSKLGFYGFIFTPAPAPSGPEVAAEANHVGMVENYEDQEPAIAYMVDPIDFTDISSTAFQWKVYNDLDECATIDATLNTALEGDVSFGLILTGNRMVLGSVQTVKLVSVD